MFHKSLESLNTQLVIETVTPRAGVQPEELDLLWGVNICRAKDQNKNEEMMWQISGEKCLNFSDEFILPLSDEVLTWQKAGGWWSVTVSSVALVIPGRMLWQVKAAVFHSPMSCMGWWHCERWAAHHSLGLSLTLPIRYLMHSVYSWLLLGQEISCHTILIEFGFFACFVENAVHKKGSTAAHLSLPVGARQEVRIPTEKPENINRGKLSHIFIN